MLAKFFDRLPLLGVALPYFVTPLLHFSAILLSSYLCYYIVMPEESDKVVPGKTPTPDEIKEEDLGLDSEPLNERAVEVYSASQLGNIKMISYYISKVGLSLKESCILTGIDPDEFQKRLKTDSLLNKIIEFKTLQYKRDLMTSIVRHARSGDNKLATWLLESQFPNEFGKKKKSSHDSTQDDLFAQAVEIVQLEGDSKPLVNPDAGQAFVFKKDKDDKGILQKISDILN